MQHANKLVTTNMHTLKENRMKTELFTIHTLTNLHVGSGDINFNVIDNQVQRDSITNLPNINSSSLKGAFREHFTKAGEDDSNMVKYIFGGSNSDNNSHASGAYHFFEASLLTRPVRSNVKPYFNAISSAVLKSLLSTIKNFSINFDEDIRKELEMLSKLDIDKGTPVIFEDLGKDVFLEDDKAIYKNLNIEKLQTFLGENIAIFDDNDFQELDLPILARNALEDGMSKNLWYEEVVPKMSKFFFCIAKVDHINDKDYKDKIKGFENRFNTDGNIVQFGANKSIGYGYSKVEKISL
jgi:CRISPR-associated protein Cmr4